MFKAIIYPIIVYIFIFAVSKISFAAEISHKKVIYEQPLTQANALKAMEDKSSPFTGSSFQTILESLDEKKLEVVAPIKEMYVIKDVSDLWDCNAQNKNQYVFHVLKGIYYMCLNNGKKDPSVLSFFYKIFRMDGNDQVYSWYSYDLNNINNKITDDQVKDMVWMYKWFFEKNVDTIIADKDGNLIVQE